MFTRRTWLSLFAGATLATGARRLFAGDDKNEPQKPKDKKRSGTVVGELTAKGKNWIKVRADGEATPRQYVPHWVGGAPKDGGGPDKKMLQAISKLEVGSRVRLEWEFEERPRVVKVEVLKAPAKKRQP
jgi:hypothetical protein